MEKQDHTEKRQEEESWCESVEDREKVTRRVLLKLDTRYFPSDMTEVTDAK